MGVDKNKLIEKIVNIILDVAIFAFGIILLISIYNNIQTKILKNSYSSFFGYTIFGVQTGSMADAINAGDWIIVKRDDNLKLNDVVTYVQDGEFITHRIVESYKNTFVTKGDANNAKDAPITRDQIVGKVVKVLPNFEIFRKTLFNPIVLFSIIVTLYLAIALFKKKNKKENSKVKTKNNIDVLKYFEKLKSKIIKLDILGKIKNIFKNIKINNTLNKTQKVKKTPERKKVESIKIEEVKENIDLQTEEKTKKNIVEEIAPTEEEIILEPTTEVVEEEDLDKTMCFRVITVDKKEIESAYNKPLPVEEEVFEKSETNKKIEEVEKEDVIKENLELLQKKGKKCKNIIEKCMYIKEQELYKIVEILLDGEKSKPNYASIKDTYIKSYIDGRYYNFCGDVNVEYNAKNKLKRLALVVANVKDRLISTYKGSDTKYQDKVLKFQDIFELINYFENGISNNLSTKEKKEAYVKKISKILGYDDLDERKVTTLAVEILRTQRLHAGMMKYYLNKLDTNVFEINYNTLSKKNMYAIELNHNIAFSKIYSDYIVDKTYTEGLIAEDKLAVLLTLLSSQIVNNMMNCEFNKKYIIYIPESVYKKNNKMDDIFDMFEDEYAKNNIIVLLQYSKLTENKDIIKKLVKAGYHFAVDINETAKFKVSDQEMFEIVDYLFISAENPNKKSAMLFINSTMHDKIILDEISSKIGSYMR